MQTATPTQHCPSCGKEQLLTYRFCESCGAALVIASPDEPTAIPPTGTPEADPTLLKQVRAEIEELKAMASAFGVERIRDGSWFNEFIRAMLATYSSKIIAGGGIAFFRTKYPGLTREQIADKLSDLANRYAALAGGASGAAASAAFAATIGTAGGASVITVPTGALAVMAEILYTTRLQVRLVYDLSHLYGYPINIDDPEDLYRAFCMAYGVAFASGNTGAALKTLTPEIARAQLRRMIHGHTKAIQQVAIRLLGPKIGKQITQRAILRAAVPVVGIGISATWNYASTSTIAKLARHGLRAMARLRSAVDGLAETLQAHPDAAPLVVESIVVMINADGIFDQHEHEVLQAVIQHLTLPPTFIDQIEQRIDIDSRSVEQRLTSIDSPELRTALAACLELVAVADGTLANEESALLKRLLTALGQELDLKRLQEQAALFQPPTTWAQQAKGVFSGVGASVGNTVSGWFTKRKRTSEPDVQVEQPAPETTINPILERIRKLTELHAEGFLTDLEFATKREEILAQV